MKKLLITLLLLCLPASALADACVSSGAGNVSDPSKWTSCGGSTPGDGDTAAIAHNIIIDTSTTIGTSGASGTAAITLQGTGSLVVNAPLVIKGDLIQQRGSSVVGNAGGSLTWTPPSGSTYVWATNNTGSGTATISLTGTAGTKFPVTTTQGGGGNTWISDSSAARSGKWTLNNVIFTYFGGASQDGFTQTNLYDFGGVQQDLIITNLVWSNCGRFYAKEAGTGAALSYIIDGFDIRNSLSSGEVFRLFNSIDKTGGTRSITNLTIYNATGSSRSAYIAVKDGALTGVQSYNISWTALMGLRSTATGIFATSDIAVNPLFSIQGKNTQTIQDSVFLTHFGNPHVIDEGSTAGSLNANIIRRNVFDGDGYFSSDAGDILTVQAATGSNFINNLAINRAGTLVTTMGSSTANNVVVTGNTQHGSYGAAIGETSAGAAHIAMFRNNLTVAQSDGLHKSSHFVPQSGFTLDYNGWWNLTDVDYTWTSRNYAYLASDSGDNTKVANQTTQSGTTTTHVVGTGSPWGSVVAGDFVYCATRGGTARIATVTDANTLELDRPITGLVSGDVVQIKHAWFTSGIYGDGTRGLGDLNADPQFVDSTMTVRGYGSWASVQAAAREMMTVNGTAYDGTATTPTTKTVAAINTGVRAAFAPTNPLYATAGYGGTYIGAVEPVLLNSAAAMLMGF